MTDELILVPWLTGPVGVGKSTVSWQIFTELARLALRGPDSGLQIAVQGTRHVGFCAQGLNRPREVGRWEQRRTGAGSGSARSCSSDAWPASETAA